MVVSSAAVAVAAGGLWVRSHWVADDLTVRTHRRFAGAWLGYPEPVAYTATTDLGSVTVAWRRGDFGLSRAEVLAYPPPDGTARWAWTTYPADPAAAGGFAHGSFAFFHRGSWDATGWVRVPLWAVVATAGSPTVGGAVLGRRRRPTGPTCTRCGYDLRATPDRCPECGRWRAGRPG